MPSPRARLGTYVGLFFVTLSTLVLEIALTRIFSVTMWYHFAFVAISVALFGMTVGALTVHLLPHRFTDVKASLARFSLLFSVAIALCFVIQLAIPFTPHLTAGGVASIVGTCIVISVPFVFSGVVVCLALTGFPDRVSRLYGVDLIGAGLGCIVLLLAFTWFDGPSLVILTAALAAVGAAAFAVDAGNRRLAGMAAVLMVALGGFAVTNSALHADGRAILGIRWTKETRDADHLYERWNAFSRLTVDGDPTNPAHDHLNLTIDSTAGTRIGRYSGDPAETDILRPQVQNLVHFVRPDADVFVVGAGGGTDVLSALEFEQRSVTAVEMNGDILDIANNRFGEFSGHLDRDPRVDLVNDEARSYLTRDGDRYDVMQISLIDTWAATSAGAFALTENSLYTTQAWDLFLDRLTPGGVLAVTRYYQTTAASGAQTAPFETYRVVALAAEVLTARGVDEPRDHILIYRQPTALPVDLATVMVSPDPFSGADLEQLDARAGELGFHRVLTPTYVEDPFFADLVAPGGPGPAIDDVAADISPPTDDRPFFFQMADIDTFLNGDITRDDDVTRPVLVLGMLAVTVLGLALACVAFPLLVDRRSVDRAVTQRRFAPHYAFFAGIGLGFLLIEVAQLQRLSIFLGHPTYGLGVVLFSVLVFSGFGSMLTERLVDPDRPRSLLRPLLALGVVVILSGLTTPAIVRATDGATTPVRIATAVALLAPLATVMGMPFSLGMRAATATAGTPTAFLWGINGATSVCASVLGVLIALFFGISAAYWAGALAYGIAIAAMVVIVGRMPDGDLVDGAAAGDAPRQLAGAMSGTVGK